MFSPTHPRKTQSFKFIVIVGILVAFLGTLLDALGNFMLYDNDGLMLRLGLNVPLDVWIQVGVGLVILCVTAYFFVKSQDYGLSPANSYRVWGILVSITSLFVGYFVLKQEVGNVWFIIFASVFALLNIFLSASEKRDDEGLVLNTSRFKVLVTILVTLFFAGLLIQSVFPVLGLVIWLLGMAMSEVVGLPLTHILVKVLSKDTPKPTEFATFVAACVGFLPAVIFYYLVFQSNNGLLFISNLMGNSWTLVAAQFILPLIYSGVGVTKKSIVGMALSVASIVLFRLSTVVF